MKEFDLIVVGSGAGLSVAGRARQKEMKVALIENGPLGGTCLNKGCIPSKILIHPAEVMRMVQDARRIGVNADIVSMDFDLAMRRMWDLVLPDREGIAEGIKQDPGLTLYHTTGTFVGPFTMQVDDEIIKAPRVVIACGVRSHIPKVPGLEENGYLLSETVFDIKVLPKSLIILGGGYKAIEFGHFFSAFGTKVTIVGHNASLLPREEPEVSDLMLLKSREHIDVHVNKDVTEVKRVPEGKMVIFKDRTTNDFGAATAEEILVTTGVVSNTDTLGLALTGVKLDDKGYVVINEFLETSQPGIWAIGDVIGRTMFRHTANYHVDLVWKNMFSKNKTPIDEHAVPHAVFGHPEVASVGMTQEDAKRKGITFFVGRANYLDCAMGYAMDEQDGFVKVIVEASTYKILGASIIGPHASMLIQSIVYLMNSGDQTFIPLANSQTIHPALSEVVVRAFGNLMDPEHKHDHG
ncbi:MAG: dihydrolipoyl dehydrogenase [Euryarchaeota archaeon]|nr:dihydrolipoyl dehydrogenase [Euryarchaeota archaeon]